MNGNQESQSAENNANSNRLHGDHCEDDGSEIEDDAPEGFQILNRSEPPWATFPDLLRVPSSTANNTAAEDDSPESLSFAASQSFRSNESSILAASSSYRPVTVNPMNQPSSSTSNNAQVIANLPRNRRSINHPDVSQIDQSNSNDGALSRVYHSSNAFSRPGPRSLTLTDSSGALTVTSSSSSRPLPPLPANSNQNSVSNRHQSGSSSDVDNSNRVAQHPHRCPINSLNLSSALHSSSISPSSSSPPPSLPLSSLSLSLAPITNALVRVQSSVDALSRQVNERLDALENRLNNLTASSLPLNQSSSSTDVYTVNSTDQSDGNHNNSGEMSSGFLKNFIKEQRRELHNERRAFLLSFSDALRQAAESPNRSSSSEAATSGHNGL